MNSKWIYRQRRSITRQINSRCAASVWALVCFDKRILLCSTESADWATCPCQAPGTLPQRVNHDKLGPYLYTYIQAEHQVPAEHTAHITWQVLVVRSIALQNIQNIPRKELRVVIQNKYSTGKHTVYTNNDNRCAHQTFHADSVHHVLGYFESIVSQQTPKSTECLGDSSAKASDMSQTQIANGSHSNQHVETGTPAE